MNLVVTINRCCGSCKEIDFDENDVMTCKKNRKAIDVDIEEPTDCKNWNFDNKLLKDWIYCDGVAK